MRSVCGRQFTAFPKIGEAAVDRYRIGDSHPFARHVEADTILWDLDLIFIQRSLGRGEPARDHTEHFGLEGPGNRCEILRIERHQQIDQAFTRRRTGDRRSDRVGVLDECERRLRIGRLFPDAFAVFRRQRLEHVGDISDVERAQMSVQLRHVLTMLHLRDEVASRPFLSIRQRIEHPVLLEQIGDLGELALQLVFGSHHVAHGVTKIAAQPRGPTCAV